LHCGAKRVAAFLATLDPLLADPVASRAALIAGVDGFLDDAVELLSTVARFGVPQSSLGLRRESLRSCSVFPPIASTRRLPQGNFRRMCSAAIGVFACPRWRRGRSGTRLADEHGAAGGERRADGIHSKAPYVGWCAFRCLLA
jgi:hypothetical protein